MSTASSRRVSLACKALERIHEPPWDGAALKAGCKVLLHRSTALYFAIFHTGDLPQPSLLCPSMAPLTGWRHTWIIARHEFFAAKALFVWCFAQTSQSVIKAYQ